MHRLYILLTVMVVTVGALFAGHQAFAEVLTGTAGEDTLLGTDMDDRLKGRGGDDEIEGGTGNDEIIPGEGDDGEGVLYGLLGHHCPPLSQARLPGHFTQVGSRRGEIRV